MKVTIKKLVKCMTKTGRQSLVKEFLDEELTKDAVVSGICKATAKGINDGINKMSDTSKIGLVHKGLSFLHSSVGSVLKATDPASDGGPNISVSETELIVSEIGQASSIVLTDETVKKLREYIVSKIP